MIWVFAYLLAGVIAEFSGAVGVGVYDEDGDEYPVSGVLIAVVLWLPLLVTGWVLRSRDDD